MAEVLRVARWWKVKYSHLSTEGSMNGICPMRYLDLCHCGRRVSPIGRPKLRRFSEKVAVAAAESRMSLP